MSKKQEHQQEYLNNIVLSKSLCSMKENAIDKILNSGRAIIKQAKTGFFKDNQLQMLVKLEINNFEMKISIFKKCLISRKKFRYRLLKSSYTCQ